MGSQHSRSEDLVEACQNGDVAKITAMIESKADINSRDQNGWTLTHWAAKEGHSECVEAMARLGASVDVPAENGRTPMHWAAICGKSECIKVLARLGARVDVLDKFGYTPFHFAASNGRCGCVETLARLGARVDDPSCDQGGETALLTAVYWENPDIVRTLLSLGADPSLKNKSGEDALAIARKKGNVECFQLIEQAIADGEVMIKFAGNTARFPQDHF